MLSELHQHRAVTECSWREQTIQRATRPLPSWNRIPRLSVARCSALFFNSCIRRPTAPTGRSSPGSIHTLGTLAYSLPASVRLRIHPQPDPSALGATDADIRNAPTHQQLITVRPYIPGCLQLVPP